jgi:hypothetical protein
MEPGRRCRTTRTGSPVSDGVSLTSRLRLLRASSRHPTRRICLRAANDRRHAEWPGLHRRHPRVFGRESRWYLDAQWQLSPPGDQSRTLIYWDTTITHRRHMTSGSAAPKRSGMRREDVRRSWVSQGRCVESARREDARRGWLRPRPAARPAQRRWRSKRCVSRFPLSRAGVPCKNHTNRDSPIRLCRSSAAR